MSTKIKMQEDKSLPMEGTFDATVSDIKETDSQFGKAAKIEFEIINHHEHEGKKISMLANLKLSQMSKLYKIITTLRPELSGIQVGDELDLSDLIGYKARVELEKKDTNDTGFPNIKRILPWDKKS